MLVTKDIDLKALDLNSADRKAYFAVKRFFDIFISLIGLIFVVPVAVVVKLCYVISGDMKPVLYKQKRIGKNGKPIYIYKFRSMVSNADKVLEELLEKEEYKEEWEQNQKFENDPRITGIGNVLRKTSLDEIPQFINVLKGDMSLVGTRPPTVNEFKQYQGHHKRRLSMKPGITGMWQAYGRSTVKDFEQIVKMDLDYIDHWSLGLDMKILCRTGVAVFQGG